MSTDFVVDRILPTNQTHIIGGASGSGKTTVMFQLLKAIQEGTEWFGYQCYSLPISYVSCDRSLKEVDGTCKRVGCEFLMERTISTVNEPIQDKFTTVYEQVMSRWPDTKMLVIDGFGLLCQGRRSGDYPSYGDVAQFLKVCQRRAIHDQVTILGSDHDAKTKHGLGYDNPKDRILGSSAWAGFSSSVIHIDMVNPANPQDPDRLLHIFPRDAIASVLELTFTDQGVLIEKTKQLADFILDEFLRTLPFDESIHLQIFVDYGEKKGFTKRTVQRWLNDRIKEGSMARSDQRGFYRRLRTS